MPHATLHTDYADLATAHVADACVQLNIPLRCGPAGLRPLWNSTHLVGRVWPARLEGDIRAIVDAIDVATAGDVLVIDNGGCNDEACVGDLLALRARGAGLAGIVIWGMHRDTAQLREIRLPLFSLGAYPARLERAATEPDSPAASTVLCGAHTLSTEDFVLGDDDGVIFVPLAAADEVAAYARRIRDDERLRALKMRAAVLDV